MTSNPVSSGGKICVKEKISELHELHVHVMHDGSLLLVSWGGIGSSGSASVDTRSGQVVRHAFSSILARSAACVLSNNRIASEDLFHRLHIYHATTGRSEKRMRVNFGKNTVSEVCADSTEKYLGMLISGDEKNTVYICDTANGSPVKSLILPIGRYRLHPGGWVTVTRPDGTVLIWLLAELALYQSMPEPLLLPVNAGNADIALSQNGMTLLIKHAQDFRGPSGGNTEVYLIDWVLEAENPSNEKN